MIDAIHTSTSLVSLAWAVLLLSWAAWRLYKGHNTDYVTVFIVAVVLIVFSIAIRFGWNAVEHPDWVDGFLSQMRILSTITFVSGSVMFIGVIEGLRKGTQLALVLGTGIAAIFFATGGF